MASEKKYNALKLRLSSLLLARNLKQEGRNVKVCNIQQAKTVGVTFVVNNKEHVKEVKGFLKELMDRGLKTFALGYIPVKKPDEYYLSQKAFNFFSDKDLDWLLRPVNGPANEFIKAPFDILIDIDSDEFFPMHYVIEKSKAGFKVGRFGQQQTFDFMMNINKSEGIKEYYTQLIHYLTII